MIRSPFVMGEEKTHLAKETKVCGRPGKAAPFLTIRVSTFRSSPLLRIVTCERLR